MKYAIQVQNLSFAYQDQVVLNDVNMQIPDGSFVGIFGPNGGGKTTLLKLLMGFLKPLKGSLEIFGNPPNRVWPAIAYVPQVMRFDRLFPISVLEVVLMGRLSHLPWYGRYKESDREEARKALDQVGLSGLEDRLFGTLSGGQAQRVLIARALVTKPKLLLLDEPTASIDSKTQQEIYALLHKLKDSMTILIVTHDLVVSIEYVEKVFCVQQAVTALNPKQVCEHFAVGLYHPPLVDKITS